MTGRLFRLTEYLRGILDDWNNQFFNTPNTTGDTMTEIYENEGIKLLYTEHYEYFEVFGLSDDEFEGLKNWADYFVKRINNLRYEKEEKTRN